MNVDAEKSSVDDTKARYCPLRFTYLARIAMLASVSKSKHRHFYGSFLLNGTHFAIDFKGLRVRVVERLVWRAL